MSDTRHILVDWGTSNLRAFLVDEAGKVIASAESAEGILAVPQGGFPATLERLIAPWLAREKAKPDIFMSGMVGSRQGWTEAPYVECPAGLAEIARCVQAVPGNENIQIVPGLAYRGSDSHHDVMRGEETQIFGALAEIGQNEDAIFCLPGTHSKWAFVRQGRIERFQTCMTGELFRLLCEHSILGRLMEQDSPFSPAAFARGLDYSAKGGELLAQLFSVRADALFDVLSGRAARSYLSGLLIGHEIRSQEAEIAKGQRVILVGAPALLEPYEIALAATDVSCHKISAASATVLGLTRIAGQAAARPRTAK